MEGQVTFAANRTADMDRRDWPLSFGGARLQPGVAGSKLLGVAPTVLSLFERGVEYTVE